MSRPGFKFYKELHFAYLEINPLVMLKDGSVVSLDTMLAPEHIDTFT